MPRTKGKQSKAAFIRSFPADADLDMMIAKGQEEGLTLSRPDIHRHRYLMKKAAAKMKQKPARANGKRRRRAEPAPAVTPPQPRQGDHADRDFVALALRVGLERSRSLLDRLEKQVADLAF